MSRYSPKEIEDKWYQHWESKGYFNSDPDEREPFSIVIPPPNVTGVLHMGHMLNNTIQDILIRRARLKGMNACWVPGTDHASIATEAKVVKMLREKGIKKSDISREEFLKYAFEWKDKYGGLILEQLKKLGASCDWRRTRFTMEEKLSEAVIKVFVDLHKKGKLYRGLRMTNWDPEALTVLSSEEVIHKDENSKLYYVRYKVEGTEDEWLTIATVRPETILGDTAIAINPKDERHTNLRGKRAIVPMANRSIPIIEDNYVEVEFGTGCLKVTPAHDQNDYEIGQRHNLEVIDVLTEDGKMSEVAGFYLGEDRFKARKLIVKDLEAAGHIVKVEDYQNKVGRSERTNAIVEPKLTLQWFLDMKDFAKTALHAVKSDEVTFYPEHFWNMYNNWLQEDNVRDWCISRQLWWGQRIPAWYYGDDKLVVAHSEEEALEMAKKESGNANLTMADLKQDEDVVDTWFSSWLWPISVFDGFEDPKELAYYYPTSVLVTGWDIMFFWVARMIMSGYEWSEELLGKELIEKKGKQPFNDVFFTGMVRDNKRRKMSKSLGNSPDALALIETYGADGVRFGMLSSAAAGNDIVFDAPTDPKTKEVLNESKLCEQGRNFCNKMWNARNLLAMWEVVDKPQDAVNQLATEWFENRLNQTLAINEAHYEDYRLSDVLMNLYKLIWGDFCSWYLEAIKPSDKQIDKKTYEQTIVFFEKLMTVLHPYLPFVTEAIWHQLKERADGEDCMISEYPIANSFDDKLVELVSKAQDVVTKVNSIRQEKGIKNADRPKLFVENTGSSVEMLDIHGLKETIAKRARLSDLAFANGDLPNCITFLSGKEKYHLEYNETIDVAAEKEKITTELDYAKGFVVSAEKKLSNERFVNNAPPAVVEREQKKLADGKERIRILEENLAKLMN